MTIGTQDMELIRKEVAGIRDFYNSRMDQELPPVKEEIERIAAQVGRIQKMWRSGEKQAILAKYGSEDRPEVRQRGPSQSTLRGIPGLGPSGPGLRT